MNINLNLYKAFYEVAKYESFTMASKKTLISQPALSYSIKTLEDQIGIKLFDRVNKTITLTEEGKKIFIKLQFIFNEFNSIHEIKDEKILDGKITIGMRGAYASKRFNKMAIEFNKIYPDIKLEIKIRHSYELEKLLKDKEVDMIIDEYKVGETLKEEVAHFRIDNVLKSVLIYSTKFEDQFKDIIVDEEYFKDNTVYINENNTYCQNLKKLVKDEYRKNIKNCDSTLMLLSLIKDKPVLGHTLPIFIDKELKNNEYKVAQTNLDMPITYARVSIFKNMVNLRTQVLIDFLMEFAEN